MPTTTSQPAETRDQRVERKTAMYCQLAQTKPNGTERVIRLLVEVIVDLRDGKETTE